MRIGHVTYRYKPLIGGAETYLASLYGVFEKAGHLQQVYQIDNGTRDPEIIPVKPPAVRLPKLVNFNLGLLKHITQLNKEDVLIVNYPEHFFPVFRHPGAVVLSHGATWTHEQNPVRRILRRLAADFAFKVAGRIVANDTFFYRELGLNIRPMEGMFSQVAPGRWFIPNCVDTEYFQRGNPREDLAQLNGILVPRNFTYPRGVDLAVRAFALFHEKHPETNLLLVGDEIKDNKGSVLYKKDLQKLVEGLPMKDSIHFLGSVPWREMPSVYSSVVMTVIPTRCSEGTSLSALESMSCGTATISTAIEGLLDLPTYKCQVDVQEMAGAMDDVYSRSRQVAGEQAETVRRVYNLKNWADAWLKVVENAAGRGR